MASQEKLPEKVQTQIVNKLLARPGNEKCADCHAKGPCWISLDFGVFICLNCSGQHRNLGPHITRVRSLKLDKWTTEWAQIMDTLGNEVAANYYERNMPASTSRPDPDGCSAGKTRTFIIMKYVQEAWAPENEDKPFTLYQKRMNPEKFPDQPPSQRASEPPQNTNTHHHVDLLDLGTPPALEQNRSDPKHTHSDLISFDTDVIVNNTGRRRSHRKSLSGDLLASPAKMIETLNLQQQPQQPQAEEAKKPEKKNAFDFIKSKPTESPPQGPAPAPAPNATFNMQLYDLQAKPAQPVQQPQIPLMTLNAAPAYQQPNQSVTQSAPKPSANIMDLYNSVDQKPHSVSPDKGPVAGGFQRGNYSYLESLGKPQPGLPQQGPTPNLYGQQPTYPGMQMPGGFKPANLQQGPGLYGMAPTGPVKSFQ